MDIKETFHERLKETLIKRKMSQGELAKRAHLSGAYISQLLQGKKTPTIKALKQISDAFELPPSYFIEDKGINAYVLKDLTEEEIRAVEAFIDYLSKKKKEAMKGSEKQKEE
jgi:transcriptional regulator with XRE-family HTH domain